MHALRLRVHISRQRVRIGGLELGNLAPVQDFARDLDTLLFGKLLQYVRARGPCAGRRLARARKSHLAEQDVAELLRAAEIDALARELGDLVLEPRSLLREIRGESAQH